jgi:hypothetical protein
MPPEFTLLMLRPMVSLLVRLPLQQEWREQ